MTPADVVRRIIPDATDSVVDLVVMGMTPFPFVAADARMFAKAASRLVRAGRNGLRLCDHCHRIAMADDWCCERCDAVLRQVREDTSMTPSKVRATHTLVTLELSAAAYDEIAGKIRAADYGHCFDGDLIDMTGIGLVKEETPEVGEFSPGRVSFASEGVDIDPLGR